MTEDQKEENEGPSQPWVRPRGLSDNDIFAILKLVRAQTDQEILSIQADDGGADVCTGFIADTTCGEGLSIECVREGDGWKIKEVLHWMS